jgi:c-di-AMP phosphodiesterase-like protein
MFFDDLGIMIRLFSPFFTMMVTIILVSSIFMIYVNKKLAKTYIFALSIYIAVTILVLVLIGCYKEPVEKFENQTKPKIDTFSQEILQDAENGVVDAAKIAEYIKNDKLSKESLGTIIQSLELKDTPQAGQAEPVDQSKSTEPEKDKSKEEKK